MKSVASVWIRIYILMTLRVGVGVVAQSEEGLDGISFCGDCWCIPDDEDTCPYDSIPKTEFSERMLQNLRTITHTNPWTMDCDPYSNDNCTTIPPLEIGGVCAAMISKFNDTKQCPENVTYSLQSFESGEEAEANGYTVTHDGACGLCSTFQDLAVYMALPSLADAAIDCTVRAREDVNDGILCYEEIGFSKGCGALWLFNSINTASQCLTPCVEHSASGLPNNQPAPTCAMVECIQCDEDKSGPIFAEYGGRTRRRSGLLSDIVRPCSTVSSILHKDPCGEEEEAKSKSGTTSLFSPRMSNFFHPSLVMGSAMTALAILSGYLANY